MERRTPARISLSLAALFVAGIAGWSLGILTALIAANASLDWSIIAALVAGGLIAGSLWLARRSHVPLRWIGWPLLLGSAIGFVGCWYWILSSIDWD